MLFDLFKKRNVNVDITLKDEITILEQEITKLKTRLTQIEAMILEVATAQDIIRNKVLRKIQFKKEIEEENKAEWAGIPLGE